MKVKTLTLESFERLPRDADGNPMAPGNQVQRVWRVLKATDTIDYTPGDLLLRADVEVLCSRSDWKVTVTAVKGA